MHKDPKNDPNLNRLAAEGSQNTPSPKGMGNDKGKTGTVILSGIITGEEYNRNLQGKSAIRIYDIMRRSDATVHSALLVCKLPILSANWEVEAASEDEADQYAARFVDRELKDRNVVFTDHLREALTLLDFGHALAEKTYELTEFEGQARIGLKSLGFRKQTSIFKWETMDEQPGVTQQLLAESVSIPLEKLIVYTHDKEGDNYEGISVLRYCYKDWDMKDKLGLVNAIALEKQSIGIPVLKKPTDADEGELSRARSALKEMRANESAYQEIPTGWDIEMMDMKGQTTKEVIPTIQYHDRQIVRSVLAQFLELGSREGSGSRALSQDHSELFIKSLEAVAKILAETLQRQLVQQICDLNFSQMPNGYPTLKVSNVGDENVAGLADAVQKFMSAGALTPNYDTEQHLRRTLDFPELPEEDAGAGANDNQNKNDTGGKNDPTLKPDPKTQAALRAAKRARQQLIDSLR